MARYYIYLAHIVQGIYLRPFQPIELLLTQIRYPIFLQLYAKPVSKIDMKLVCQSTKVLQDVVPMWRTLDCFVRRPKASS